MKLNIFEIFLYLQSRKYVDIDTYEFLIFNLYSHMHTHGNIIPYARVIRHIPKRQYTIRISRIIMVSNGCNNIHGYNMHDCICRE